MNLDDVVNAWRSQDLSSLGGVDKSLLHQVLRQEQTRTNKQLRRLRWLMYVVNGVLLLTAVLFLAIMIDPHDDDVLIAGDYVIGGIGVAAAIVLAVALFALRRSRGAREEGFDDSLRDHLRRRIALLEDEATSERRLALITVAATWICGTAISIAARRINDVPYTDFAWPRLPSLLVLVMLYLLLFRCPPRWRRRKLERKRQLEGLLKEFDGQ